MKSDLETTVAAIPDEVHKLIRKFALDADRYKSSDYKELSLRTDYLNPIFELLGWDIQNKRSTNFTDREVILEYAIRAEGVSKSPDYAFLVENQKKFFVEAKRPAVNIAHDRAPSHQIRRYCWSAGLPFGIVTDFEEWAIYDCRAIPNPTDSPHVGRIAFFTHEELPTHWNFLKKLFGRDEVISGSIENYANEAKAPVGTRPIDEALLDEIRIWRSDLAKELAKAHPDMLVFQLNFVVQTLIDRLMFLRIAEARGLEEVGSLKRAIENKGIHYQSLMKLFQRADDRYNSGLFHIEKPGKRISTSPYFPQSLSISNKLIDFIISRLYEPEPYEFSVVPPDILGRIYEQFLGETIEIDNRRTTQVVVKPEVRKAGGVYYTPLTVVQFIIENTIGPLLENKTPEQVSKLRILDPACGSGSFLIAALQYIYDWHVNYYAKKPQLAKKFLERKSGERHRVQSIDRYRLRTSERKRILLNNIFGVDIDRQAVEVAKLSLLLKVIEGESQYELQIDQLLPDLESNIRCGNSLISDDFHTLFFEVETPADDVNPFNWELAFPDVFKNKGFDAIVGNPPYLSIDSVWGKSDPKLSYIKSNYNSVYSDKSDILFYFIKKAVDICKGEIGFIVSRSFLEADKAQKLRGWLASNAKVRQITDFREATVFPKIGINTAIIGLTHSEAVESTVLRKFALKALPLGFSVSFLHNESNFSLARIPLNELGSAAWNFGNKDIQTLLKKIDLAGPPVGDILKIGQGMQTGANDVFKFAGDETLIKQLIRDGLLYQRARNSDIGKFSISNAGPHYLFLENVDAFKDLPKIVKEHLKNYESALRERAAFKRGDCDWWRYTWPLHLEDFENERIYCPYLATENRFALDRDRKFLGVTDTTVLYDNSQRESLKYFVGILNSRVLTARFKFIAKLRGGGVYEYFENTVRKLPIPRLDLKDSRYLRVLELVDLLNTSSAGLRTTHIAREIESFRTVYESSIMELDDIVNELYGISQDELDILEHASSF